MKVKVVNNSPHPLPKYGTPGSAGMDLRANLREVGSISINPLGSVMIPTGIFIEIPEPVIDPSTGDGAGWEAQIRPRSGMAAKFGISVLNTPGTIDSDYRGEIKVILVNLGAGTYIVGDGDKIAQMVFNRYEKIGWDEVTELSDSERGTGGFGHTDKKQ